MTKVLHESNTLQQEVLHAEVVFSLCIPIYGCYISQTTISFGTFCTLVRSSVAGLDYASSGKLFLELLKWFPIDVCAVSLPLFSSLVARELD